MTIFAPPLPSTLGDRLVCLMVTLALLQRRIDNNPFGTNRRHVKHARLYTAFHYTEIVNHKFNMFITKNMKLHMTYEYERI